MDSTSSISEVLLVTMMIGTSDSFLISFTRFLPFIPGILISISTRFGAAFNISSFVLSKFLRLSAS